MGDLVYIVKVENDDGDGVIVTFSDGTIGGYVVEELLTLRPLRERVEDNSEPDAPRDTDQLVKSRARQPAKPSAKSSNGNSKSHR